MDSYNGQHQEFDVREMPPPRRHDEILKRFDSMKNGEGFVLVNDHDPKPLYHHLLNTFCNVFLWEYLEKGPEVWRVKITKVESDTKKSDTSNIPKLDVREFPPAKRHELIYEKFENLQDGNSFELINDHDPIPLYYQLIAEYDGNVQWEYEETGPDEWRVIVGK